MDKTRRNEERKQLTMGAARFSVASAAALAASKFAVGLLTGSLGVLSSAVDNVADILMSGVNYLSLRKSLEPADRGHPYGHGKIETLGMLFEGVVIAATGGWIVWEGIRRLRAGVYPDSIDVALVVMAVSVVASWYIARRLYRAGVEVDSPALRADSLHFRTDVYSGAGIFASLAVYRITGWKWLDAATGLAVGVYIIGAAGRLLWEALHDLTDRGLPHETVEKVRRIIDGHRPLIVDFHDLRTRRSGSEKHVDFHVVVCRNFLLQDAHRVADHLEMEVSQALGNAHVVTHIDPCDIECPGKEECARLLADIRNLEVPDRARKVKAGARTR
jgi:ferrous-iron efflux pump FieF